MPMMRRYVLALLGLLALIFATLTGISWLGLAQCPLADRKVCGIYHFQQAKLQKAPERIDVLLLGDSSLGHGLDAHRFAALSGKETLNLALVGSALGLPAVERQLRAVLSHRRIANIVIMISPEDFRHRFKRAAEGYVFVSHGNPLAMFSVTPGVARESTEALFRMLFDDRTLDQGLRALVFGQNDLGECPNCTWFDFILQQPPQSVSADDIRRWRAPVDDFDPFLQEIGATCRSAGANCLFLHGPILQSVLDLNPDYVPAINGKVRAAGLTLVADQPIIIPESDIGDSINHVREDLRPEYTERFYRQLAPLLK